MSNVVSNAALLTRARTTASIGRRGVMIAIAVVAAWVMSVVLGVWLVRTNPLVAPFVVALRALATTGLFITAHDAMHGLVVPRHPRINDAIGALCLGLYAFLPYPRLRDAHHVHHRIPAREGDPDWRDAPFARWFFGFFMGYVSWRVLAANALTFTGLAVIGAPISELVVVWVVPALLSALQLFTFGTYLPHRAGPDLTDPHRARSTKAAPALSFLQCFHFGYHFEHHDDPSTPWWLLPARRRGATT